MEKDKTKSEYNADDPAEGVKNGHNGTCEEMVCEDGPPQAKVAKLSDDLNATKEEVDVLTLNPNYTTTNFTTTLSKEWTSKEKTDYKNNENSVQVFKEPFQICLLPDLLESRSNCRALVDEMIENVTWSRKQMDLYEFYQSTDLSNLVNCKLLTNFLQMLRRHVRPWLEEVTNLKLDYVSASCSMYTCGDYLLVHDDLLKDRQVAFIYYLTPWEGAEQWQESFGGCLEIFDSNEQCFPQFPVRRKISPRNNQFAFFKVGARSFHQVGEVTNYNYPRLTINGWFHGASNDEQFVDTLRPLTKLNFKSPQLTTTEMKLVSWINGYYLKPNIRTSIQKRIEDNSETCLYEFLNNELFLKATEQLLNDNTLIWQRQGPANAQNYEILEMSSASKTVALIFELFSSPVMFELLRDYTDLDLAGEQAQSPSCHLELQRWTHGNYTVLGDGAICEESTLDLIYYLNANKGAGIVTYLSPEEEHDSKRKSNGNYIDDDEELSGDESDDESVLLTITPIDNALNMIYRCEGTTKFTKYVSRNTPLENGPVFILTCSYKE